MCKMIKAEKLAPKTKNNNGPWVRVEDEPHPIGEPFIGYYGKTLGKDRAEVCYHHGIENAITHWFPLPDPPTKQETLEQWLNRMPKAEFYTDNRARFHHDICEWQNEKPGKER